MPGMLMCLFTLQPWETSVALVGRGGCLARVCSGPEPPYATHVPIPGSQAEGQGLGAYLQGLKNSESKTE